MTVTRVTEAGQHSVTVPAHRELRVGTLNACGRSRREMNRNEIINRTAVRGCHLDAGGIQVDWKTRAGAGVVRPLELVADGAACQTSATASTACARSCEPL